MQDYNNYFIKILKQRINDNEAINEDDLMRDLIEIENKRIKENQNELRHNNS